MCLERGEPWSVLGLIGRSQVYRIDVECACSDVCLKSPELHPHVYIDGSIEDHDDQDDGVAGYPCQSQSIPEWAKK